MQTFMERANAVVWNSQLSVQVLLSPDNDDLEFIYVKQGQPYISAEEYTARKLRPVGFVGLNGLKPLCAWSEPLPPSVISRIACAFTAYVCALLGDSFAEHMAAAEVAELHRLYSLADPRMN